MDALVTLFVVYVNKEANVRVQKLRLTLWVGTTWQTLGLKRRAQFFRPSCGKKLEREVKFFL